MTYRDFPFPDGTPLFPTRAEVLAYLHRYADSMDARSFTRFRTAVDSVKRISSSGPGNSKWLVKSHRVDVPDTDMEDVFDFVGIASGWARVPHVPLVQGMEHFRGSQLHSAWYRSPVAFRGKRVVIVGNFSSGADIARELCGGSVRTFDGYEEWNRQANSTPSETGTVVYHSYRDPTKPPALDYYPLDKDSPDWCKRINVVASIDHVNPNGSLTLVDGKTIDVDVIVWATGFWRSLPYIDSNAAPFKDFPLVPRVGDKLVQNKHCPPIGVVGNETMHGASCLTNLDDWQIFYEPDKTLALLGVPVNVIPFPLTNVQAKVIATFWAGRMNELPRVTQLRTSRDPKKWTDAATGSPTTTSSGIRPTSHDIESPAEEAYLGMCCADQDALVSHLPGEEGKSRAPWDTSELARGPEGFAKLSLWRLGRLHNRVKLRREHIHY